MALILARLLATTTSHRLWEVRTGVLRSLLSSVSQGVRAPFVEQSGYASAARPSPARCALAMGEPITSWNRVLRFDYSRVPGIPSTFGAVLLACLRYLRGLVAVGALERWLLVYLCLLVVRLSSMCRVGGRSFFAQFLASSVSPGAAVPPLLTSLMNCLS